MSDLAKRVLLNLLSNALFDAPLDNFDDADWQEIYNESVQQTVSAIAFSAIERKAVSDNILKVWEENTRQILINNNRVDYEHATLHQILLEAHIPYVILKGNASASCYPDPMLRTMGDVDFLIDKKDIDTVDMLLREKGFTPQPSNHECERAYHKGISIWELHWQVNGVPGGEVGRKVEVYLSDVITQAELVSSFGGKYMSPSVFHHGLIMLLHVARHMVTGGIGLRHVCDWAVFVQKIGNTFPSIFEKKLRDVGLWRFAQLLTQLSVQYLGCPSLEWIGDLEVWLLEALKDDMFAAGNFGHKDLKRADEAKFITNRRKGGVNDDSALKQSVLSANEIVRRHWKFADKIPVVYPIGWTFFGGRYAIRSVFGKRKKIDVTTLSKGAQSRKEIYKQIKLFEK